MTILTGDCLDVLPTIDPFAGSGTVPAVAQAMGRQAIGIELNPEYAEIAARRTR